MLNETKFTAIICDDEASVRAELRAAIDWDRLHVQLIAEASDGKEALDLIMAHTPDLAIIDIRMPQRSGLEAISSARSAGLDTDFIILSGYDDFSYAQQAIQYGAKAYLLKPIDIAALSNELYRVLGERAGRSHSHMNQQFKKQLELQLFCNLLDGKILEPSALLSMLQTSDLSLSDRACFVLLVSFEDMSADSETLGRTAEALEHLLPLYPKVFFPYKNAIVGIFNQCELLPEQLAEIVLEFFDGYAALRADAARPSSSTSQTALNILQPPIDISRPLIGIGDMVPTLMQAQYSYSRALTALSYQLYGKGTGIFTADIICTVPPQKQLSDFDCLPLIQAIIKCDHTGIQDFCRDFLDALLYVRMPAPNYIFSLCYALMYQVEQEFSQYSHQEITERTAAQSLYRCKSLPEIKDFMRSSFTHLSDYIDAVYGFTARQAPAAPENIHSDDELIQKALGYIRRHIAEHLKVNDIAKHVHLSPSYFAIYFKNKTGICLRDYLSREKMEYARRSLVNPELSIYELAENLGYRDYRSFSRAFKALHGLTPSEFQGRFKRA